MRRRPCDDLLSRLQGAAEQPSSRGTPADARRVTARQIALAFLTRLQAVFAIPKPLRE
jgi:hypothetical protein